MKYNLILFYFLFGMLFGALSSETIGKAEYLKHSQDGKSFHFFGTQGERLRITPYGDYIIRVQAVPAMEEFYADDRYEMVESHNWPGLFIVDDQKKYVRLNTKAEDGLSVFVNKETMTLSFSQRGRKLSFLEQNRAIQWNGVTPISSFRYDPQEHFTGLGHGFFGREQHLDLQRQVINRNYGTKHHQQAPLIVPFYLSSKGYGVFVNSTFPNSFSFGKNGVYEFSLDSAGQLDYFVILGPEFKKVIDRYTQLTGRPRFPPAAAFGLALSDKGNDHNSTTPSDKKWWKNKIIQHRNGGFPLDHIVNDNRWRAGGGKRCESYLEWDLDRFPDPRKYEEWVKLNGLFVTLDFNRCIASHSEGWQPLFNIPQSDSINFKDSAPDLTKKDVRDWFWNLFWKKSLNPALNYPGDALWIDEFDEMGNAPSAMVLGNGRTWREMKNYWFFLIAKALVQQGWDKNFAGNKRPFVWVRGMTAGAQRYATLWSGDIKPEYEDMKMQVRSMQLAGLSGFPYWGHDAGGFHDWENKKGPDDAMYRQWAMAFGSFSPFWKPHGMGESRWPLDRSVEVQNDAKTYSRLRYRLMPYTYTLAHEAFETGMPIARAMVIDHQNEAPAWKNDLQYMWGDALLVAPNCSDDGDVNVWLPAGKWYDFWDESQFPGDKILTYSAATGKLPLFVKAGAIIPMANFALSTASVNRDSLNLHIYTGADGSFLFYEDDGFSEAYKMKNEKRTTKITFEQKTSLLNISAAVGTYKDAPTHRIYRIDFHGFSGPACFRVNGVNLHLSSSERDVIETQHVSWDEQKSILSVFLNSKLVTQSLSIQSLKSCHKQ